MTATAPVRRRRWVGPALVASLAVNLLLLGAAAAAFIRHRVAEAAAIGGFSGNLLAYAQSLPGPRRHELWRATKEERHGMHAFRAEMRAARHEWREALAANPFDRTRFERAQSRLLEAENKARAEAQRLFLAIAAELSAEERASFVRWQARDAAARRGGWRGGRGPDNGPPDERGTPPR